MASPTHRQLHVALGADLKKAAAFKPRQLINDIPRKTFIVKIEDAVFEFPHKQPDQAYWSGIKHYGSGTSSRVRIRRTQEEVAAVAAAVAA